MTDAIAAPAYDAVLLVSFGGPEGPDDVLPFLENVTRGRGDPARAARRGRPSTTCCSAASARSTRRTGAAGRACARSWRRSGLDLPVYWGNRNWDPYLADAVAAMARDGVRRALAFVTVRLLVVLRLPAVPREPRSTPRTPVADAPAIDKIRPYFDHPGFVEPFVDATVEALGELPDDAARPAPRLVFTTHSIPVAQAGQQRRAGGAGGAYVAQHRAAAALWSPSASRARPVSQRRWDLVFQSRSGPPAQPWLEPDVGDHLEQLAADDVPGVVMVPDRLRLRPRRGGLRPRHRWPARPPTGLGLPMARAATPGTDPRFVAMVVDLVRERVEDAGCRDVTRSPRSALAGRLRRRLLPQPARRAPAIGAGRTRLSASDPADLRRARVGWRARWPRRPAGCWCDERPRRPARWTRSPRRPTS